MITRVSLKYFKQFEDEVFDLSDHVVLAGPNNSGKSTLLQAIVTWSLALRRWNERRGPESGSAARLRTGIPLTRKDFTALPLREMDLLWTNTQTALKKDELAATEKAGKPRLLSIGLEGNAGGEPWSLTFKFQRSNTELVYVRPQQDQSIMLPVAVRDVVVVHVPPFSGIGAEETRYDRAYQDLLVGQSRAGDILRNLLLEVYQNGEKTAWPELTEQIERTFGYHLLPPIYEGQPFIVCDYLRGVPKGKGKNGLPQLDIASAGSGFHQVLLLLGFLYARPSTVLLLDEPDAHLHVILQKQVYDMLRKTALDRKCQLIVATHAEVLIDATNPDQILSFFRRPHRLTSNVNRDQVREALKRLSATDILLAEQAGGVLYVEGETDFDLLRAWARILDHPLAGWFERSPFWRSNHGRDPKEARAHFFALRAIDPNIFGLLLLDGDNRDVQDQKLAHECLRVERWQRYEAESYLVHPIALVRFIESLAGPLFANKADQYLRDQLPPAVYRNPLDDHEYLRTTPASKTLLPGVFDAANMKFSKNEYYLVAEQMTKSEIPSEVAEKLDAIASAINLRTV